MSIFERARKQTDLARVAVVCGFLVVAAAMPGPAVAQDISASHLAAAEKTLAVTGTSRKFDSILLQMSQSAKADLISNRPDKDAEITAIVDEQALKLAPRRADLEKELVKIYAANFSETELNEISDFFNSEAGKKFVKQSPIVMREVDRAAKVWAAGIQRDLATAVSENLSAAGLK
ncbi:MAG: DUF2059 domain-containing protein [Nitratireductor sp.]|nr:DUF2059 domain-containing protein [Nitratireductor sp.]MCC0019754.1 DUF2059 domain-containing protein [Nitratireductor sp.]